MTDKRILPLGALLLVITVSGCSTFGAKFDPSFAGNTLDEAAIGCLDWAWYSKSFLDEVAGGVIETPHGYKCGRLFVGTPKSVTYFAPQNWAARFHTHVIHDSRVSRQDKRNVREDPRHKASYIRLRNGQVVAYECQTLSKGVECAGRQVRTARFALETLFKTRR